MKLAGYPVLHAQIAQFLSIYGESRPKIGFSSTFALQLQLISIYR